MNHSLHGFCLLFCISLGASAFYAVVSYVIFWRKDLWLRFLDAEESFWKRVGLPWLSFDKRFGASRLYAISMVLFSVIFLVLAVGCAVLYFHFRHQLMRG